MIAVFTKAKVCVICRSRRPRRTTQTVALIIYRYHAKTESNNLFIMHIPEPHL